MDDATDPVRRMIKTNQRNTILLLAYLVLVVVALFGGLTGTWQGALTGLAAVVVYILVTLPFSADAILLACRARKAGPADPRERRLLALTHDLAAKAGMEVPRVYVEPSANVNAFAVGISPRRSAICVTRAALDAFDEDELAGVVGHELAHIRNRDTLVKTVAFGVVGALGLMAAALAAFAIAVLAMPVEGEDDGEKLTAWAVKLGLAIALFMLAALTFAFLFLAKLGYFAISRNREYLADATSVELNGTAEGLKAALRKLAGLPAEPSRRETAMASLYMVSPARSSLLGLLETHPPVEKRIARLDEASVPTPRPPRGER